MIQTLPIDRVRKFILSRFPMIAVSDGAFFFISTKIYRKVGNPRNDISTDPACISNSYISHRQNIFLNIIFLNIIIKKWNFCKDSIFSFIRKKPNNRFLKKKWYQTFTRSNSWGNIIVMWPIIELGCRVRQYCETDCSVSKWQFTVPKNYRFPKSRKLPHYSKRRKIDHAELQLIRRYEYSAVFWRFECSGQWEVFRQWIKMTKQLSVAFSRIS